MTLSKIIVECFVKNLTLSELREFTRTVLIPQQATGLLEHAAEAEKILAQRDIPPTSSKSKLKENVKA